jgi:hypothetical protein
MGHYSGGYCPDKPITKINLSHLLAEAMASPDTKKPCSRPIQRLCAAYSTYIMSIPVSYHTIKTVAAAQRHSVLINYRVVPVSASRTMQEDKQQQWIQSITAIQIDTAATMGEAKTVKYDPPKHSIFDTSCIGRIWSRSKRFRKSDTFAAVSDFNSVNMHGPRILWLMVLVPSTLPTVSPFGMLE